MEMMFMVDVVDDWLRQLTAHATTFSETVIYVHVSKQDQVPRKGWKS